MTTAAEETIPFTPRPPAVKINSIGFGDVWSSLASGWRDFLAAPLIGLFFGGDRDRPAGLIGTIALAILAPIAAALVQMAISRGREYE
eukprot:gene14770-18875_t